MSYDGDPFFGDEDESSDTISEDDIPVESTPIRMESLPDTLEDCNDENDEINPCDIFSTPPEGSGSGSIAERLYGTPDDDKAVDEVTSVVDLGRDVELTNRIETENEMDGTEIDLQSESVRVSEREIEEVLEPEAEIICGERLVSVREELELRGDGMYAFPTSVEKAKTEELIDCEVSSAAKRKLKFPSEVESIQRIETEIDGSEIRLQSVDIGVSEREMDSPIGEMSKRTEISGSDSPKACSRTETGNICSDKSTSSLEKSDLKGTSIDTTPIKKSKGDELIDCEVSSVERKRDSSSEVELAQKTEIDRTDSHLQSEDIMVSNREMYSPNVEMSKRTKLSSSDSSNACSRTETEIICRDMTVSSMEKTESKGTTVDTTPTSIEKTSTKELVDSEVSRVSKQKLSSSAEVLETEREPIVKRVLPKSIDEQVKAGRDKLAVETNGRNRNEHFADKHKPSSMASRNHLKRKTHDWVPWPDSRDKVEIRKVCNPAFATVLKALAILSERS
ncbi:hypothetical protein ACFE04_027659 [Oxalis oulophora]